MSVPLITKIIPIAKIADTDAYALEESKELARWIEQTRDGQLAIDMYETADDIVILSALAGVDPEQIEIGIENDIVTIRGTRARTISETITRSHYEECYWGAFSRSILIPNPVNKNEARAEFSRGILTIRLPKIVETYRIPVTSFEE
ncbi:MAG: Hsp20/alpha crystallin family protein [Candidatus Jacksonbacteria bacterium]|nr:Hsp20/alpha crystallin family protein [Candidatus Jacksonbacteria bacterium]